MFNIHDNSSVYIEDIDTPHFHGIGDEFTTKHFVFEPIANKHFLELFEFRLQNEPLDSDPFNELGEKFEDFYTEFFTYMCNVDNYVWVIKDRLYIVGMVVVTLDVDYNNYQNRSANIYYELLRHLLEESHEEVLKAAIDKIFRDTHIDKINMEGLIDGKILSVIAKLGFERTAENDYVLEDENPEKKSPPRHMPFIINSYKKEKKNE